MNKRLVRNRFFAITASVGTAAIFATAPANAVPVHWTLQDVTFNDGGTASGSFLFDTDTSTYSNVDIITTAGSLLPGTFFSNAIPGTEFTGIFTASSTMDLTGSAALIFGFGSGLTEMGGLVALGVLGEGFCTSASCFSLSGVRDTNASGTSGFVFGEPVVSQVPLPAGLSLVLSGLAAFGWVGRNKRVKDRLAPV